MTDNMANKDIHPLARIRYQGAEIVFKCTMIMHNKTWLRHDDQDLGLIDAYMLLNK